eukprot:1179324-Prorocentrum_minimum.AAC.2
MARPIVILISSLFEAYSYLLLVPVSPVFSGWRSRARTPPGGARSLLLPSLAVSPSQAGGVERVPLPAAQEGGSGGRRRGRSGGGGRLLAGGGEGGRRAGRQAEAHLNGGGPPQAGGGGGGDRPRPPRAAPGAAHAARATPVSSEERCGNGTRALVCSMYSVQCIAAGAAHVAGATLCIAAGAAHAAGATLVSSRFGAVTARYDDGVVTVQYGNRTVQYSTSDDQRRRHRAPTLNY